MENKLGGVCCVYAIRCRVTKRIYIGSSDDVVRRVTTHFRQLMNGDKTIMSGKRIMGTHTRTKSLFQNDFDKFGIGSFEVFILEQDVPEFVRDEREEFWIDKYKSTNSQYGYNIHKKCRGRRKLTIEVANIPIYYECPPFPELEGDVSECESNHTY